MLRITQRSSRPSQTLLRNVGLSEITLMDECNLQIAETAAYRVNRRDRRSSSSPSSRLSGSGAMRWCMDRRQTAPHVKQIFLDEIFFLLGECVLSFYS